MYPRKSIRDIRAPSDRPYNRTPIGPFHTEEERRRLRESIPHGVHPRVYSKDHSVAQSSYYVPVVPIPEDFVHPYDNENFATRLIASVPDEMTLQAKCAYWEESLLKVWFHLYGDGWSHWRTIIPWIDRPQLMVRAAAIGCEQPWNWMAKRRFLEVHNIAWSLDDLNYLIDRYPDRQTNEREQGIYVGDKSFSEIQDVAKALSLPTREVLDALTRYARELNMGR